MTLCIYYILTIFIRWLLLKTPIISCNLLAISYTWTTDTEAQDCTCPNSSIIQVLYLIYGLSLALTIYFGVYKQLTFSCLLLSNSPFPSLFFFLSCHYKFNIASLTNRLYHLIILPYMFWRKYSNIFKCLQRMCV